MNREGAPGKSPEEMYIQQKVRVLLMLRKMGSNLTASEEEFLRTYAGVVSSQLSQLPQHSIDQESVAPALPDGWSTRERFRGGSSLTHRAEPQLAAASRRGACRASRASRPVPSPSPAGSQGPNQVMGGSLSRPGGGRGRNGGVWGPHSCRGSGGCISSAFACPCPPPPSTLFRDKETTLVCRGLL
uniref:Beta-catenin-interacting protein 1 n=1 Tax=Tursiops truncatus TaxID=9739 RepID=A0A6J3QAQ0_TURTR|nr:beta-catenin-interacting protein 1 isoform X2 [Tursiops truncatus]